MEMKKGRVKLYQCINYLFPEKSRWRLPAFIVLGKYFEEADTPSASYSFYHHVLDEIKKKEEFVEAVNIVKEASLPSLHNFFKELVNAGLCEGDPFDPKNKKFKLSELGKKCYKLLNSYIDS